jgi:transcriptional regulator with XRE-family HTH domain
MDSRPAQGASLKPHPVGDLLRGWRNRRAMSQADLAFEAGISVKHMSNVETGKAIGSRETLLQLAAALGLSLRDRNALLEAGGFARQYGERDLKGPRSPTPSARSTCCCGVTSRFPPSSPTGNGT